jgi:hypothetical protein
LAASDVHPFSSYAKQTLITLVEQMAKWQSAADEMDFPARSLPFDGELWFSVTTSEHYLGVFAQRT